MTSTIRMLSKNFVSHKWMTSYNVVFGQLGMSLGSRSQPVVSQARRLNYKAAILKEVGQPLSVEEVTEGRKLQNDEVGEKSSKISSEVSRFTISCLSV